MSAVEAIQMLPELNQDLRACATEADLVQVLYGYLNPRFGYDIINMHVLEHEGWYHSVIVERGVLQDVIRRRIAESDYGHLYDHPRSAVVDTGPGSSFSYVHSRGPGNRRQPQRAIWMPITYLGQAIGAVIYQIYEEREVPASELDLLEKIHAPLGVLVHNAYLNALTRDQAISFSALNAIARALSATREERDVTAALYSALGQLLPLEQLDLALLDEHRPDRARLLTVPATGMPRMVELSRRSRRLAGLHPTLRQGKPQLDVHGTVACAPLLEGGRRRGALIIRADQIGAYERSTLAFLEQVAHEVVLALRNAWSYAALEAQRRRLAVVNTVGRKLASSLDLPSIQRTLREELARHLAFDVFSLVTVEETEAGPVATAYVYDSGQDQVLPAVPLGQAGPSRQAYETARPVLIRRSPWAHSLEQQRQPSQQEVRGDQALLVVTRPRARRRVAARSMIWVPARTGERVAALLTVQSYTAQAFDEWHVHLLEDVAAHVGLALANAAHFSAAQIERRRLEAVHELDMGVAAAADEREIADAFFAASRSFLGSHIGAVLAHLDSEDRLTGWRAWDEEAARPLSARPGMETQLVKRLVEGDRTAALQVSQDQEIRFWRWPRPGAVLHLLATPVRHGGQVNGLLILGREEAPFTDSEVRFVENAALVLAIALRTERLHTANEMALAHSVRLQEVASLAGHDLGSVAESVAELARTMLRAAGVACWAFDPEARVMSNRRTGDAGAGRVLLWAGRSDDGPWTDPPRAPVWSLGHRGAWTLIPLWYGERLVGAIGAIRPSHALQELGTAALDFSRHAAVAIENARLADETRGRIHVLRAIAAFSRLDVTKPAQARTELARLIAEALDPMRGALWLFEGHDLVRVSTPHPIRARMHSLPRFLAALDAGRGGRMFVHALTQAGLERPAGEILVVPVPVGGRIGGLISADLGEAGSETRRLMTVLAGQAGDVLTRLELVAERERQARTMEAILRHSPVGVVLESGDGRIAFANRAIERLYGVAVDALIGAHMEDLYRRSGAAPAPRPDASIAGPIEMKLRDRVIEVRRMIVPGSGEEPERALTLHEDVTQEHNLQEAKDLMLRAIGHEVRSPAAAMRATIASLIHWNEVIDSSQRKTLLDSAYDQSQRLLALVEGQLIISQLETGRFQPNPEPVDLRKSINDILGLLRFRYGERTEVISVDLPERTPQAHCEATHLGQVLMNLLSNALEYSLGGVWVRVKAYPGWVEVTVEDSGQGVPSERIESLFTRQVPAGQKRARGGLGLGLYLCRLVVERSLGGRIWLDRNGSQGAVFKFTVPASPPSRPLPEGSNSEVASPRSTIGGDG